MNTADTYVDVTPERVGSLLARVDRIFAVARDEEQPVYQCRCGDLALIMVDDLGHGSWRPCAYCNPRGHELWSDGHWNPAHRGCATCAPTRRRAPGAGAARDSEPPVDYQAERRKDLY